MELNEFRSNFEFLITVAKLRLDGSYIEKLSHQLTNEEVDMFNQIVALHLSRVSESLIVLAYLWEKSANGNLTLADLEFLSISS